MTRPDRQTAEALAARLSGLDLPGRLLLIAAEIPGRLVFTTSLGVEDQALTHALAMAKLANGLTQGRVEIVTLDTGRLFAETYDTWAETEVGLRHPNHRLRAGARGRGGFRARRGHQRLPALGRRPAGLLRLPQGRAAGPGARRRERLANRIAGRPVGQPRRDAARGVRCRAQPDQAEPPGRLVAGADRQLRARQRRSLQRPARSRLPVDRLRPLHPGREARRAGAGRAAGGGSGKTRRNAACMSDAKSHTVRCRCSLARSLQFLRPAAFETVQTETTSPAGVRPMSAALAAAVPPSAPAHAQTATDRLSHLKRLEAEAIHIFRETVAETENPGDALLDRQGFLGAAAPRPQGVRARAAAVPPAARRHHVEVPRDDRLPRCPREGTRPRPPDPHQPGRARPRNRAVQPRLRGPHRRD